MSAFKLRNNRIFIIEDPGNKKIIFIYDYIKYEFARYHLNELMNWNAVLSQYDNIEWFGYDYVLPKSEKGEFLLIGAEDCNWPLTIKYQDHDDINSCSFEIDKICFPEPNMIYWRGFGHVIFNNFLITFCGMIEIEDIDDQGEWSFLDKIYLLQNLKLYVGSTSDNPTIKHSDLYIKIRLDHTPYAI